MRFFVLLLTFLACLIANASSDVEAHRSLDAIQDCYEATTDLVDPRIGNGGLMDFPNFLFINILICNSTARNCDYAGSDYEDIVGNECTAGKILTRDVKVCQSDLGRNTGLPAASDIDYINIPFCMATICPDDVEIVELHKLLYAEAESSTTEDNPYTGYVDTMAGVCLVSGQTDAPAPSPTAAPASDGTGIQAATSLFFAAATVGVLFSIF